MKAAVNRPLSPHLQVYRPQLTSVLSIGHRATGIILCFGAVALSAWLISLALGEQMFNGYTGLLNTLIGKVFMLGWLFSFFYHLCNGVRHLCWDAGYGYEITQVYQSGWMVVLVAFGMTIGALISAG
ncbi:MAG: succinate dehydrogenase, cytochrome b556 subunit [Acidiferrobacteraceae bacterium]|nr:succinate dehydrogenase, cytochrome b556 subunit [Acidiferrobacteraceae bacterium]MBT3639461.1 succinate dehydrogenase, cytochrome b556 subunit [Acidiferrobacteraceae bacterium]MBT3768829.1 succinate dehydrogenase, cytochrome b556 subunit [Acidiferrobacteraceae bacterium]MBT3972547.1 succinate dehydrogenase, cytochrome b556 subunit [Acidiferrobacteraceae bacterium]MBT4395103.1 succinate dehydrogenase, cytochrome b556 subunit [Acidiferrobacteraceae bacterium]